MKTKPICLLALLSIWPLHLDAAEQELPAPVRNILNLRQIPHDTLSVHIADLDNGETVLGWHDEVSRNPASTMKLVTTLVALDVLGLLLIRHRWNRRTKQFFDIILHSGLHQDSDL